MASAPPLSKDARRKRIERLELAARLYESQRERFLLATGWEQTSATPDRCWRWAKTIKGERFLCDIETAYSIERALDGQAS